MGKVARGAQMLGPLRGGVKSLHDEHQLMRAARRVRSVGIHEPGE